MFLSWVLWQWDKPKQVLPRTLCVHNFKGDPLEAVLWMQSDAAADEPCLFITTTTQWQSLPPADVTPFAPNLLPPFRPRKNSYP
jgi:hypothetical protein